MNAIRLLTQQHREVEELFERLGLTQATPHTAPVASHLHPDSRRETTHDAEGRFRDEGGASAMDLCAAEYDQETRSFDKDSELPSEAVLTGRGQDPHLDHFRQPAALQAVPVDLQGDEKRALFEQLAQAILAHTTIEEQLFYPAARTDKTEDLVYEAVEDHQSVKRLIDELRRMDVHDRAFDLKLELLHEKVQNHVGDEEGELFPNVMDILGEERLDELGRQMAEKHLTVSGHVRAFDAGGYRQAPAEVEAPVPANLPKVGRRDP